MRRADVYHSDPDNLGGRPVFTGTRVPIETLLVYLRKGKCVADFRDDFPTVSEAQAAALLELAAQALLEEIEDLAAIEARADEPTLSFDAFVREQDSGSSAHEEAE